MASNLPSTSAIFGSEQHQVIFMTEEEFRKPITDEYAKKLSEMSPDEIYDNYNPGPTTPDGKVNFECHCVSHLVASPCGYEFRNAISCQKEAADDDLKDGKCAEEFVTFMKCVMETKCFRAHNIMANVMDQQPTTSLKRPADGSDSESQSKRRLLEPPGLRIRRGTRPNELQFIKGGSVNDPLNLSSVKPEDGSPEKPLEVIVPRNLRDPLNISQTPLVRNKKKKKDGLDDDLIVSPVVNSMRRQSIRGTGKDKPMMQFPSLDRNELPGTSRELSPEPKISKKKEMNKKYRYGNFNRYYGDRFGGVIHDPRLDLMCEEWFFGKNVLDVGCNAGYLTLSIAKEFRPRRILGIDIDPHLIGAARKNIRFMDDRDSKWIGKFPPSFGIKFGPLAAPSTAVGDEFPNNISFRCENYVLDRDEQLEQVHEGYDTILALSITKYVHLNFGDAGIKRFFQRIYRELLPDGKLILEAQPYDSYKKRAKMTDEISKNFKEIRFFPSHFKDYLLSEEVGFQHCEDIGIWMPTYHGFKRPLQIYYKTHLVGAYDDDPWTTPYYPMLPLAMQPTPVRQVEEEQDDFNDKDEPKC